MKKLFLPIIIAASLVGCAHPQLIKPVSTVAVHQSIHKTDTKIADAQTHTKKIVSKIDAIQAKVEAAKVPDMKDAFADLRGEVDQLTQSLVDAREANKTTEEKLQKADSDYKEMAKKADANYKALVADEDQLKKMRRWWGLGAILYGCGILLKHVLILVGVVLLALTALAMLAKVFPVLGAPFEAIESYLIRHILPK